MVKRALALQRDTYMCMDIHKHASLSTVQLHKSVSSLCSARTFLASIAGGGSIFLHYQQSHLPHLSLLPIEIRPPVNLWTRSSLSWRPKCMGLPRRNRNLWPGRLASESSWF